MNDPSDLPLPLKDLREYVLDRSRGRCEFPRCSESFDEMAHLQHRGMGGGPGRNTRGNVIGLCRRHHLRFDNSGFTEEDWHDLLVLVTERGEEGCDWLRCNDMHSDAMYVVLWQGGRQTWRMYCGLHGEVIRGDVVPHRRAEVRILMAALVRILRSVEVADDAL